LPVDAAIEESESEVPLMPPCALLPPEPPLASLLEPSLLLTTLAFSSEVAPLVSGPALESAELVVFEEALVEVLPTLEGAAD
jgi:hypothetical protein